MHLVIMHEACPESKDTKVLNMYNIFSLQNNTVNELPVHKFNSRQPMHFFIQRCISLLSQY